ncbi:EPIDERMAL PATTERNING FACTOR-like protein 8 [Vigna radiata var. radiata]|uniref:Epidermal patterning factor-like protein n=1 Tax=Vigna radiata var. radiata TaxID=3916 RepID=A0A3Q0FIM5_VIGRR|nr:EPIDERMAL PATTERNING FACTOR-like protein 8 [Vigna radiata var. radiata]
MAPPARSYPLHGLKLSITVLFIFFVSLLPSKSGGSLTLDTKKGLEQNKMVIGSKPPACVNKCKSCRPCMATLVVPNHQKRKKSFRVFSHGDDDDTYYLLSWKCKCGDKLFQP